MKLRKASHCSYRIRYHMVFVVKYRKSLVSDEVFEFMKEICRGIEERYFVFFDAIGHEENHVHVVVEGAPRYSPSRIMQICKSILAIQVFKKFPKIKEEELWGGEFWSDGGHIDTVGDGRALEQVRNYVRNQGRNEKNLKLFEFHTPQLAAK
ncbi:IS200/IS605 family transposase [Candidatus Pacearchaeota archaeon]|nr:IS200/IS605 family transposase [Candidatus Pacearchaeota archaeon]